MGKVVVDLVVRDLKLDPNNLTPNNIVDLVNTSLTRIKLFVGTKRVEELFPKVESFLPHGRNDIKIP